jgi:molybdopterin-guanine dinucleotide biosynthesis protein A
MGAVKRFAEEVSVALGFDGTINNRVMVVTALVIPKIKDIPREQWKAEDKAFRDLVNRTDHEYYDAEELKKELKKEEN